MNDQERPVDTFEENWRERFFVDFDRTFEQTLAAASQQVEQTTGVLESACAAAAEGVGASREALAEALAGCRGKKTLAPEHFRQLIEVIDAREALLFRRIRPALEQQLRPLLPPRKPVLSILEKINTAYCETAGRLPEEAPPEPPGPAGLAPRPGGWSARLQNLLEHGTPRPLAARGLARSVLLAGGELKEHRLGRDYAEACESTSGRLADLWRGLRFHLDMATEELAGLAKAAIPEAQDAALDLHLGLAAVEKMVLDLLEGFPAKLREACAPLREFWSGLPTKLREEHQQVVRELHQALEHPAAAGTWLHRAWRRIDARLAGYRRRVGELIEESRQAAGGAQADLLSRATAYLKGIRKAIGKDLPRSADLLKFTDLPTRAEVLQRAEQLPPLYRRLFTLGPLKNREFLVARETELKCLEEIFRRWEAGRPCSVALIGPEGSGKTSLANCFASEFGSRGHLIRASIDQRLTSEEQILGLFQQWFGLEQHFESLAALIEQLLTLPRGMVLIEEGHNLALRVIGGSRAAKAFFYVLMATRQHFLWMVSFRKTPWERMNHQLEVSRYFTHQVTTLLSDRHQLREVLMIRQRTSGYPLIFLGDSAEQDKDEKPTGQDVLAERFFKELYAASRGDIEAAIYYWLLCLEYDEASGAIRACHLGDIDHGFLRNLEAKYHFSLAEILGHGVLSAAEHARIFRLDPLESRLQLDYLASLNLLVSGGLEEDGLPGPWSVNPIFHGAVTATLEAKHILY
ncbi:hypothetical protein DESUT3_08850 [Desulfuromonas versatilis]|uniref:AAA+ ATPase domain-containing protein n=1 Tax=Desulfuromonas versatilis TaxID=2802975 RepID=A0ABM8HS87_9BACT|nr:ATP-binding protein [Desulfuromonas versatilis]BCR03816.1 hypothetical protein DESUT3_08850 [Desulfuromonas versatilis]